MATNNSINSGLSGTTGTGSFVGSTSPTLVTPALGTPASGSLVNCTGAGVAARGFSAYYATTQSLAASTFVKCSLDTELWDTDGTFDSTTNYRHTPTTAGKYLYQGQVAIASLASGNKIIAELRINGSAVADNISVQGGAVDAYVIVSKIVNMNGSTDYAELFAFHNNAGSLSTISAKVWFQAVRVE